MRMQEYAKHIAVLAEKFPRARVVYSCDDEGNAFNPVHYVPTTGRYDEDGFTDLSDSLPINVPKINAICIN